MPHERNQELFGSLDEVCSMIVDAEAWHAMASNECYGLGGVDGWGVWHGKESLLHKRCLDKLTKILQRNLDFTPQLNLKPLDKINQFEIRNIDDFIKHHREWIEREERFNEALITPLLESKKVNRELHKELENLQDEAQHQIMLVKKTFKRIKFAEFMPHDIAICSYFICKYFDYDYDPRYPIYFNIG